MAEENKPIELEDDALESVNGGVMYDMREHNPSDYGSTCTRYKGSGLQKCCRTCQNLKMVHEGIRVGGVTSVREKWHCRYLNCNPPFNGD